MKQSEILKYPTGFGIDKGPGSQKYLADFNTTLLSGDMERVQSIVGGHVGHEAESWEQKNDNKKKEKC